MDKGLERWYVSKVFGSKNAASFQAEERPDFTATLDNGAVLGIEATSIFSSNAAAKLTLNRDYYESAMRDASRIHRRDRLDATVLENAVLRFGKTEITTNVMRFAVPSTLQMLGRLKSLIEQKSGKIPEYSRRCHAVDLVIADESGVLSWHVPSTFRAWLAHFLPRSAILESGFREIYLTLPSIELGEVTIALKGSLFISEVLAYANLTPPSDNAWAVICACLNRSGFGDTHVSCVDDYFFFRRGAWELEYRGDSFTAHDLRFDLGTDPHLTVRDLVADLPTAVERQAEDVIITRPSRLCGVGLMLVEDGAGDRQHHRRRYSPGSNESAATLIAAPRLKLWPGLPTDADPFDIAKISPPPDQVRPE